MNQYKITNLLLLYKAKFFTEEMLSYSVVNRNTEMVKIFLRHCVSPNAITYDEPVLHIAIARSCCHKTVLLLLKHPETDPTIKNNLDKTPLFSAAQRIGIIGERLNRDAQNISRFDSLSRENFAQQEKELAQCIKHLIIYGSEANDSEFFEKLSQYLQKPEYLYVEGIIQSINNFIIGVQKFHNFTTMKTAKDFLKLDNDSRAGMIQALKSLPRVPQEIHYQIVKTTLASALADQSSALFSLEREEEINFHNRSVS